MPSGLSSAASGSPTTWCRGFRPPSSSFTKHTCPAIECSSGATRAAWAAEGPSNATTAWTARLERPRESDTPVTGPNLSKWRWTSSADTVSGRPVTKTLLLAASVAPSAEPWFAPPTATEEETEAAATTPNAMKGPPARTIRCSAAEWRAIPGQLTSRLNVSDACSRVAAVERPASRRQRLKPSQQTAPRPWGSPATAHAPDGATLDDEAQRLPLPSPSMRSRNEAPHVPATARPVEPGSGASVTPCRKASEAHNRPRRLHAIARGLHARRWSSAAKTAAEIAPKPGAHGTKTGYPRCLSSVDHRAMHE